ncbi:peptide chain release factor N(5)-glutamine methyltransferase [Cognatazoarcus halotolerans]|uniref:peptide chain release factor N(5)-glutamine methyltransferase n=1 Tax=Cognatazoarcus halotolerans TaxID=2686016 RepID=UPI00135CED8D|nr:peptide chain release factor N(5)-glutamine methyltransferase [Cognatazoarcus halotolerans]
MDAERISVGLPSIAGALSYGRRAVDAVDARLLLREVLDCSAVRIAAYPEERLSHDQWAHYQTLVRRREAGEPIAYILGRREFYGRSFKVSPAVLIPRPETELLVERALQAVSGTECPTILDLGTGSGAIAITIVLELADRAARVCAVDVSAASLDLARENARLLGANVEFCEGSWFGPLLGRRFDCIVSNPPYIRTDDRHLEQGDLRFEPPGALSAGVDGLNDLRDIIEEASVHLNRTGWLFVEHGYDQAWSVGELLAQAGFEELSAWPDLAGVVRVSGGRFQPYAGPG